MIEIGDIGHLRSIQRCAPLSAKLTNSCVHMAGLRIFSAGLHPPVMIEMYRVSILGYYRSLRN